MCLIYCTNQNQEFQFVVNKVKQKIILAPIFFFQKRLEINQYLFFQLTNFVELSSLK